jgi:hypothetical protein
MPVYSKDDLIAEVKAQTPIGEKIVEMHMKYLRSFKEGKY